MSQTQGANAHASQAEIFCRDESRVDWHSKALWVLREKRDRAAGSLPEWEQLRDLGSAIKLHTLTNLPSIWKSSKPTVSRTAFKCIGPKTAPSITV